MRSYRRNSPESAARIVSMVLLADCHVSRDEMDALKRHDIPHRLDLSHPHFMLVTQQLCDDLRTHAEMPWQGAQALPTSGWHAMLDEIDDTGLRLILLDLCATLVESDHHIDLGEQTLVHSMADHWHLPRPVWRHRARPLATPHRQRLATVALAG